MSSSNNNNNKRQPPQAVASFAASSFAAAAAAIGLFGSLAALDSARLMPSAQFSFVCVCVFAQSHKCAR